MPRRAEHAARVQREAEVFRALGDATRLEMVERLSRGTGASIRQLTEGTRMTRQAVTKHLRVLEGAGLLRCEARGRERVFALEPETVREMRLFLERVSATWDQRLAGLKGLVEPDSDVR